LEYNKTKLARKEDEFQVNKKEKITSEDLLIGYAIKYPEKINFIKKNLKFEKYL
jgi:hypothetical protein